MGYIFGGQHLLKPVQWNLIAWLILLFYDWSVWIAIKFSAAFYIITKLLSCGGRCFTGWIVSLTPFFYPNIVHVTLGDVLLSTRIDSPSLLAGHIHHGTVEIWDLAWCFVVLRFFSDYIQLFDFSLVKLLNLIKWFRSVGDKQVVIWISLIKLGFLGL